jgi:hypothetical protein
VWFYINAAVVEVVPYIGGLGEGGYKFHHTIQSETSSI